MTVRYYSLFFPPLIAMLLTL